jgi:hypothetical protein
MGSMKDMLENEALRQKEATQIIMERKNNINNMLEQFQNERMQMNNNQMLLFNKYHHERITMDKKRQKRNDQATKDRINSVKHIHNSVNNLLKDFHENHIDLLEFLRHRFQVTEHIRMKKTAELEKALKHYMAGIKKDTTNLLNGFHLEHKHMKRQLRENMNDYIVQLLRDAKHEHKKRMKFLSELLDLDYNPNAPKHKPKDKEKEIPKHDHKKHYHEKHYHEKYDHEKHDHENSYPYEHNFFEE